jgi:hypothetical protein
MESEALGPKRPCYVPASPEPVSSRFGSGREPSSTVGGRRAELIASPSARWEADCAPMSSADRGGRICLTVARPRSSCRSGTTRSTRARWQSTTGWSGVGRRGRSSASGGCDDAAHDAMKTSPSSPSALAAPAGLGDMVLRAATSHSGTALRFEQEGAWRELSYAGFGAAVREVAGGLIARGIEPGDRVAVLSETRPEWTIADCVRSAPGRWSCRSTTRTPRRSAATCSSTRPRGLSSARTRSNSRRWRRCGAAARS